LKAFDIETGKELWSINAKREDYILPLSLVSDVNYKFPLTTIISTVMQ